MAANLHVHFVVIDASTFTFPKRGIYFSINKNVYIQSVIIANKT